MADYDLFSRRLLFFLVLCTIINVIKSRHTIIKRNYSDQSVRGYLAEVGFRPKDFDYFLESQYINSIFYSIPQPNLKRTCWWNEVCKEEFHSKFRCRCPRWSYCRAPGKYYDAHCSITRTGYIWTQPEMSLAVEVNE